MSNKLLESRTRLLEHHDEDSALETAGCEEKSARNEIFDRETIKPRGNRSFLNDTAGEIWYNMAMEIIREENEPALDRELQGSFHRPDPHRLMR
jgi:hypothetical protein